MGIDHPHPHDKDLEKVMLWLVQERRQNLLNLTLTAIGASGLMVIVAYVMPYLDDEADPADNVHTPIYQIFGMDWTDLVFILFVAGFTLYYLFKGREQDSRQPVRKTNQTELNDSEDESLSDAIRSLGPSIIFGIIPSAMFYLSLMSELRRRRTATILLSLFRMCGEPLDIEAMEIEGLGCDEKTKMLLKLKNMGWVYLAKDLKSAGIESNIEQALIRFLGYHR